MKTYVLFFPTILSILLISCGGKTSQQADEKEEVVSIQYPVTISFEQGVENKKELALSDIATNVTYIPLETKTECLVSRIRGSIKATEHSFYIPCNQGVFQFTREGRFVRPIGKKGQGPGEYSGVYDLQVNEATNRLYILTNQKLLAYTLEGEYLSQIRFQHDTPWQFHVLNDTLLCTYYYNSSGQVKDCLSIYNTAGDSIHSFPQYDRFTLSGNMSYMFAGTDDRYLSSFDHMVYLKEYYNDTLFVVTPGELIPRYILTMGKYTLPVEKRFERIPDKQKYFDETKSYMRPNVIETTNYVFIPAGSWGNGDTGYLVLYDKATQSCFSTDKEIPNDIDTGCDFTPYTHLTDNTLLAIKDASEICEQMEKNPSLKEHIILKQVKEDDNPVLMVVTLK